MELGYHNKAIENKVTKIIYALLRNGNSWEEKITLV
jgi:hypothetical protein